LPRLLHLPAPPGLRLRVAPYLAPFLLSRRPTPRVAPWLRSFGCAGDGPLELPRTSHAFGGASFSEVPSFPGVSRLLRAAPLMEDLGCPSSCISGFTGDGSSSCPDFHILRRCRLASPRVAPSPSLSVSPTIRRPGCPKTSNPPAPADRYPSLLGSLSIRFALVESPSCPGHSPLATAIDQFPGCPKSRVFRRSPLPLASSCPEPWFPG